MVQYIVGFVCPIAIHILKGSIIRIVKFTNKTKLLYNKAEAHLHWFSWLKFTIEKSWIVGWSRYAHRKWHFECWFVETWEDFACIIWSILCRQVRTVHNKNERIFKITVEKMHCHWRNIEQSVNFGLTLWRHPHFYSWPWTNPQFAPIFAHWMVFLLHILSHSSMVLSDILEKWAVLVIDPFV